jgi:hypothetical protein
MFIFENNDGVINDAARDVLPNVYLHSKFNTTIKDVSNGDNNSVDVVGVCMSRPKVTVAYIPTSVTVPCESIDIEGNTEKNENEGSNSENGSDAYCQWNKGEVPIMKERSICDQVNDVLTC